MIKGGTGTLRTRNSDESAASRLRSPGRLLILAAAVAGIAVLTLWPTDTARTASALECIFCGKRALADVIVNVMLYIPLGVGLALVGVRLRQIVVWGLLLSTTIEAVQIVLPGRDASLGDVIANTVGAALGGIIAHNRAAWLAPSTRVASVLCYVACAAAVTAFASTAYLLAPSFPRTVYFGQWTPNLGHLGWYRGTVLSATVGGVETRSRRVLDSDELRASLLSGDTIQIRAVAGPPIDRLASLFSVYDRSEHEILLIGPDRSDFVLRYRAQARRFRLDQPDLRVRPTSVVSNGDSIQIRAWRVADGWCLELNEESWCPLGFTIGSAWTLVFYAESWPAGLMRLLNAGWVASLFLLLGFWWRNRAHALPAIAVAGLGLAVVPILSGLQMTPLAEWTGAVAGLAGGVVLQRLVRNAGPSRSTPSVPELGHT